MMCRLTKVNKIFFALLSLLLTDALYAARAKVNRSVSKAGESTKTLYDVNNNPISDDTLRSLSAIESEALASLARTEGYEGVALIFKNEGMDFVETVSEYAEATLQAKLRAYDYAALSSEYSSAALAAKENAVDYVDAILVSKNLAASYEANAGSYSSFAGSYSEAASTMATQVLNSLETTVGYEALAYDLIQTITGYQSQGSMAIAAANSAVNVAVTSLLYGADTTTFNVVSLGNAPLNVLNAGARALQSIGSSISNVAENAMVNPSNLILATAVTSNAAQGISALSEAANADASSISFLLDALGTLAVGMRQVANSSNATQDTLTETAHAIGSLCDATTLIAESTLNNIESLNNISNSVPLLVTAMQAVIANASAGSDACNTLILYSYDLGVMTKELIVENMIIDATVLSPAAVVASQLALVMQSVALNQSFINAENFAVLRQRLLRTIEASVVLINAIINSSLLTSSSDINSIGNALISIRNVHDLLVVVWELGDGAEYQNNDVIAKDVLMTTALDNFNASRTKSNLIAMGSALTDYSSSLMAATR